MGSSFAPAFWLLPPERRRALFSLHAFCRAADDTVDGCDGDADEARGRLQHFRHQLDALYEGGELQSPEAISLAPYVRSFALPRRHFDNLLDALAQDVDGPLFQTEEDFTLYCEGVASAPGQLALSIFGCPEAEDYGKPLGVALQFTNILRDARDDLSQGRVYFPLCDLEPVGLSRRGLIAEAQSKRPPDRLTVELLAKHAERARRWFARADAAYREQSPSIRRKLVAARGMQRIYHRLLERLARGEPLPRVRVRSGKLGAAVALVRSWGEAFL